MARLKFSFAEEFPELAGEIASLLADKGESSLGETVAFLTVVDRCRCGDDFCATMYTAPRPKGAWGPRHRTVSLDPARGYLNVDVVDDQIVEIEVLYRDEIRERLLTLMP